MILHPHISLEISNLGPKQKIQQVIPIQCYDDEVPVDTNQIAIWIYSKDSDSSELSSWCRNMTDNQDLDKIYEYIELTLPLRCQICLETYFASSFINPLDCHEFCKECLDSYFKDSIKRANVINIKCPWNGCTNTFTDIEYLLRDEELIRKYIYFKNRQILEQDPRVRFCPDYTCGKYVRHDGIQKTVKCECGIEICVNCHLEAHSGRNCTQLQIKIDSRTQKKLKIYKCPSCKAPIQKANGCNVMSCDKCHYCFCWVCFKQYKDSFHYKFYNPLGCPFGDTQHMDMDPLPCPTFISLLMLIPKLILLVFMASVIIIIFPFLILYTTFFFLPQNVIFQNIPNSCTRFLLAVLISPVTLILAIFVTPIYLAYYLIDPDED